MRDSKVCPRTEPAAMRPGTLPTAAEMCSLSCCADSMALANNDLHSKKCHQKLMAVRNAARKLLMILFTPYSVLFMSPKRKFPSSQNTKSCHSSEQPVCVCWVSPCGPSWPCLLGTTSSGQERRGLSCLQFMFFSFHFFLPIILSYYNFFVSYFWKVVSILFGNSVKSTEISDLLIKIIAWLFLTLNIRLLRKQIHPKQGDN